MDQLHELLLLSNVRSLENSSQGTDNLLSKSAGSGSALRISVGSGKTKQIHSSSELFTLNQHGLHLFMLNGAVRLLDILPDHLAGVLRTQELLQLLQLFRQFLAKVFMALHEDKKRPTLVNKPVLRISPLLRI